MRKTICVIITCVMVISLFSGCTMLQKLGMQKNNDELFPVSYVVMGEEEAKKLNENMPVYLYFANEDNTKLVKEIRYVPLTEAKKSVNNLASIIVDELIKGPSADSGLKRTIPVGTKQKAKVKIDTETRIATVDLSKEFVENHPGGKAEERMTIYSIVNSLTELKEIEKVQFLIEGKTCKEFKGNFQFDVPFPRTVSLISKEAAISSMSEDSLKASAQDEGAADKEEADASDAEDVSDSEYIDVDSEYIDVDAGEYQEEDQDADLEFYDDGMEVDVDIGDAVFDETGEVLE